STSPRPRHGFTDLGDYTVTVTVTDKDGGATTVSAAITIVAAQLQTDTADPTKTALVVGGTPGSDVVRLNTANNQIDVTINGVSQGQFSPTGRILIYGQ